MNFKNSAKQCAKITLKSFSSKMSVVLSTVSHADCRYVQNYKCSATFELNKRFCVVCILFKKINWNFASNYKLLIDILFWLCFTPSFLRKRMLRCAPCKTKNHDHEMIFAFFPRNNAISCRLVRQGRHRAKQQQQNMLWLYLED